MSKDEIEHAGIEACARKFDIHMKKRIERKRTANTSCRSLASLSCQVDRRIPAMR